MTNAAHVRLDLSNSTENVPLVRQAFTGFAEALGLSTVEMHDINTALTEACNNVSLHAYDGADGPLEIELFASIDAVVVTVRDEGRGFATSGTDADDSADLADEELADEELADKELADEMAGIGLPAIRGLSTRMQVSERPGGGTEVVMTFATPSISAESLGDLHESFDLLAIVPKQVPTTVSGQAP